MRARGWWLLFLLAVNASSSPPPLPTRARSPVTQQRTWFRSPQQGLGYEVVEGADDNVLPVVLLNGFGVGSFHWARNFAHLTTGTVFAVDYLGQGRSWPVKANDGAAESEQGLRYAIDDWAEQIIDFLDAVVLSSSSSDRAVLVGNSLGGLLAALLAARHPDKVARIALLNATPVWGSNLPGWDGVLPGPPLPRAFGRFMYDQLRDPQQIQRLLTRTYATANDQAFGSLPLQIRQVTDVSAGGHAAFASILFSPPATLPDGCNTFVDLLKRVNGDVLLLNGREDPWVSPPFGLAAHQALLARPNAAGKVQHVELSPAGHCLHHEVPHAANPILRRWLQGQTPLELSQSGDNELFEWRPTADVSLGGAQVDVRGRFVGDHERNGLWGALLTSLVS